YSSKPRESETAKELNAVTMIGCSSGTKSQPSPEAWPAGREDEIKPPTPDDVNPKAQTRPRNCGNSSSGFGSVLPSPPQNPAKHALHQRHSREGRQLSTGSALLGPIASIRTHEFHTPKLYKRAQPESLSADALLMDLSEMASLLRRV